MQFHERQARCPHKTKSQIATIVAGERPTDLTREEAEAYDLGAALNRGTSLPEGILGGPGYIWRTRTVFPWAFCMAQSERPQERERPVSG
jgi:hypothetical protein